MYLSKLKIFGFKSFAQKSEVLFPGNGLTAVVGPNGCGKSNIVDAIRWVIGEQRASQLRMSKMQDVIFSGTEDRPAQNMAEVTLVINNDKGLLPSGYSEIQITRRVYRSGDTEYLINNQECRLKDIHNLFYDTGMGAASYSLMEQKMIDAILSDKAEERRVLFEEAAGVSKYKQQRKETIRQLEKVSLDMERVEVSLRSLQSSIRQHEKQVEKAKQVRQIRDRLRGLEISMAVDRFSENQNHLEIFRKSIAELQSSQGEIQTRITLLDTCVRERRLEISGDEEEYRSAERAVSVANKDFQEKSNQVNLLRADRNNHEANQRRFETELANSQNDLQKILEQIEEGESFLAQHAQDQDDFEPTHERLTEQLSVLKDRLEDKKDERRELQALEKNTRDLVTILKSKWARLDAQWEQLQKQEQTQNQDLERLNTSLAELQNEIAPVDTKVQELRAELESALTQIVAEKNRLGETRQKVLELEQAERAAQQLRMQKKSRLDALEQLRQSGAGLEGGAKWVLEQQSASILGMLAEQLQVKDFAPIVEFSLGQALQSLVLTDNSQIEELLQGLENSKAGLVSLVPQKFQFQATPIAVTDTAIIGTVRDFVQAPQLESILDYFLKNWYIVSDFSNALRLAQSYSGQDIWFISTDLRAIHGSGMIKGGQSSSNAGLLARKQESERLALELETAESAHHISVENLSETRLQLSSLEENLRQLEKDILVLRTNLHENESTLKVNSTKQESFQQQVQRILSLQAITQSQLADLQAQKNTDQELHQKEAELQNLENQLSDLVDLYEDLETQVHSAEEDLRDLQNKRRDAQNQKNNAENALSNLRKQKEFYTNLGNSRRQDIQEILAKVEKIAEQLLATEANLEQEAYRTSELELVRDKAKEKFDTLMSGLDEWNEELQGLNKSLREKDNQFHEAKRREESITKDCDQLKERIFETWEYNLEEDQEFQRLEYDQQDTPKEIRTLKEQLKGLGQVSDSVMEDYETEKARLEDVKGQFEDLGRAKASLERTIDKLDKIARERFLETFRQIQKNFQEVFASLMVGGEAQLQLHQPDDQRDFDPLEAEILVNARPTGKKMRGVKALSGGERALTATSLLFALYMVKPSPYCILDEVDGPLDDANIGRFVGLLRRFSVQTQFIIVTHNKRTMAACDMLYGVTQEIKGISRISAIEIVD